MSNSSIPTGIKTYMDIQLAKAKAAEIIGKAIVEAEKALEAAGIDTAEDNEIITEILEAALE